MWGLRVASEASRQGVFHKKLTELMSVSSCILTVLTAASSRIAESQNAPSGRRKLPKHKLNMGPMLTCEALSRAAQKKPKGKTGAR